MGRKTVHLDLTAVGATSRTARDLVAGAVVVQQQGLSVTETVALVVHGADQDVELAARVVSIDEEGVKLELVGVGDELRTALAGFVIRATRGPVANRTAVPARTTTSSRPPESRTPAGSRPPLTVRSRTTTPTGSPPLDAARSRTTNSPPLDAARSRTTGSRSPFEPREPTGERPAFRSEPGARSPFEPREPTGERPAFRTEPGARSPFEPREPTGERPRSTSPFEPREATGEPAFQTEPGARSPFEPREATGERPAFRPEPTGERPGFREPESREPTDERQGAHSPFEPDEPGVPVEPTVRPHTPSSSPFEPRESTAERPALRPTGARAPYESRESTAERPAFRPRTTTPTGPRTTTPTGPRESTAESRSRATPSDSRTPYESRESTAEGPAFRPRTTTPTGARTPYESRESTAVGPAFRPTGSRGSPEPSLETSGTERPRSPSEELRPGEAPVYPRGTERPRSTTPRSPFESREPSTGSRPPFVPRTTTRPPRVETEPGVGRTATRGNVSARGAAREPGIEPGVARSAPGARRSASGSEPPLTRRPGAGSRPDLTPPPVDADGDPRPTPARVATPQNLERAVTSMSSLIAPDAASTEVVHDDSFETLDMEVDEPTARRMHGALGLRRPEAEVRFNANVQSSAPEISVGALGQGFFDDLGDFDGLPTLDDGSGRPNVVVGSPSAATRARILGESESPDEPRVPERRIARNVQERLRGLTTNEQLRKANSPDPSERIMLERLYGKNVWEALLRNPRLTAPEVARIARMGTLPRPLLEVVVANSAWLQIPEIRRALLSNPRLGPDQIQRVLKLLSKPELKLAATQNVYPFAVRDAAKRLVRED